MSQKIAPLPAPQHRPNDLGIPERATPTEARALLEQLARRAPRLTLEELDARMNEANPPGPTFAADMAAFEETLQANRRASREQG